MDIDPNLSDSRGTRQPLPRDLNLEAKDNYESYGAFFATSTCMHANVVVHDFTP